MNAVLLAAVLAFGRAAAPAATPAPLANHRDTVEILRLRVVGVDAGAFARELALRLPDIPVVSHDAALEASGFMVFVDLKPGPKAETFTLTLVASDGRAYDRTVEADPSSSPDDEVRLLAGNVANLVSAIAAGTEKADREDVPIPPRDVAAVVCPSCPEPAKPLPSTSPRVADVPAPKPPKLEIGVGVTASSGVGLGAPAGADRHLGAGGSVALWLRHRSGLLVGVDVRAFGRRLPFDTALVRARVGLALGYAWRRGDFELATTAAFGIEPWWVRANGRGTDVGDLSGQSARRRPLAGGGISIVPAHRFHAGRVDLRLGPRVDIGASSAIGDRGRVAELLVNDAGRLRTVGRLGGWELGLGIDLVVWIPVRSAR